MKYVKVFRTCVWVLLLAVFNRGALTATPAPIDAVRLPGHVLAALQAATPSALAAPDSDTLSLTLLLRHDDTAGFERYLQDVYDPASENYRHFLTPLQVADRFGPSRDSYTRIRRYLQDQRLHLQQGSNNRMTLSVRGTRAQIDRAFALRIADYEIGTRRFYANDQDPALPAALASNVQAIAGLSNLAQPHPSAEAIILATACIKYSIGNLFSLTTDQQNLLYKTCIKKISSINYALGFLNGNQTLSDPSPGDWVTLDGTGQTIGLLEFDSFQMSDVGDYLALIGAPAAQINNLNVTPVNGGTTPGANQDEVLLDIDTVMTGAPGAKVAVYDAPFTGQASGYLALFNAMINGGVTIISNSWASCEDQVSAAEAQSIDAVLKTAAASGISVFNGAGDNGGSCLDGSSNTVAVPADSPNATAVGGTSPVPGPGVTYGTETWWNGATASPATGQGGFGVSKYFGTPSYQSSLTGGGGRSVPDVVSAADPASGILICDASNGGCPNGLVYGGTSYAAPSWAVFAAILNEAHGSNLGAFNPLLYPLANSNGFHSAASMGSDFAHVGLGSPNLNALDLLLNNRNAGAVNAATSEVQFYLASGLASSNALPFSIPADGATQSYVVVRLRDAATNTAAGKTVTLSAAGGSAKITPASAVSTVNNGAAIFTVTDLATETLSFTATDATDGVVLAQTPSIVFAAPPAVSAGISANPMTVPADGQSTATIIVTLKDSLNRPTVGKSVTLSNGGTHAVISGPTPGVTNANGQIQFTATDQVNETVTFTATDVSDNNLAVPGSATVTYSGSTSTACNVNTLPVAGAGYSITPYITGLPAAATIFYGNANIGCPGADNPIFTPSGNVLVADFLTGGIYQLGLAGGTASSTTLLNTLTPALGNLVFGKDGNVYATLGNEGAQLVQIDPNTGSIVRTVASGLTCPAGLSVDPLSGDLFFDDQCTGGGTDNASIFRVIDPSNTNPANPTSVVVYATLPNTPNGGLAFAPNGTLYAVSGYYNNTTAPVQQISGTNVGTVTVTALSGITSDYPIAIGTTNSDGSAQSLLVEPAGNLSEVPLAAPANVVVLATGAPGVGVTGPDGCLYSARYNNIYRLANSTGTCAFTPTSPAPSIALTPASISPNPAQGTSQTFTASLHNVASPAGIGVIFSVNGVNLQQQQVNSDANGNAAFSYTALLSGSDAVTATATANGTILHSNTVQANWTAGAHVSFLSLNTGPQGGTVNQPVSLVASLSDVSVSPAAALLGQTVSFSLEGATCTATTTAAGLASCSLTPSQAGLATLTVTFAGNSQYTAASISTGFRVSGAAAPAATVKITVSPTSVVAGGSATLTWSSSNATTCTASGSWSGTQPVSGSQSVTPATTGSFTYTLTCTGAGGTASASAVLSASLVAVTVHAKSGGGALGGYLLLALGLLVAARFKTVSSGVIGRLGMLAPCAASLLLVAHMARADQAAAPTSPPTWLDPFYLGVRAGYMPVHIDAGNIDRGLNALGFPDIHTSVDKSGVAGTLYAGFEFAPHTAVELGYTYRNASAATLNGSVASSVDVTPLLQGTAGLIRGYGNIVSLSYSGDFEIAPRVLLQPRLGGFFWATKVSVIGPDDRIDATHEGGGVTAGITAAYRVWRGLELGVNIDHFHGFPSNVATLYGGSVEWRFGH